MDKVYLLILIILLIVFLIYNLLPNCNINTFNIGGDVKCNNIVQGCTWNDFPPTDCLIDGTGQNENTCIDGGGKWYEEKINPLEKWDTRFIGGWCQCYADNPSYWDPNYSNTICPGGFQSDGSIGPFCGDLNSCNVENGKKILSNYKNKWLTIGGDNVGTGKIDSCIDTAFEYIQKFGFNGICFDMEGCLNLSKDSFDHIKSFINGYRNILPFDFKFIYVGGEWPGNSYDFSIFTHICPMLYTNQNYYQYGDTSKIDSYLKSWIDNNIPKNKIILSFQTQSGAGGDEPRNELNITKGNGFIKQLTDKLNEGYAGLLGWPPVYNNNANQSKADADLCLRIINKSLKRQPNPSPKPKPKPKPCIKVGKSCGELFNKENCCLGYECKFPPPLSPFAPPSTGTCQKK
jgi:hypothetical protein